MSPTLPRPSDIVLHHAVRAELNYEPCIDAARIGVVVNHGIVSLVGSVSSSEAKELATRVAFRATGLRALVNHLVVDEDGITRWSDEAIALNAAEWLTQKLGLASRSITIAVEKGHLSLGGEVETMALKVQAEKELAKVAGIGGIANAIRVVESPRAEDIRQRVHDTLKPIGDLSDTAISVVVDHGVVTLNGRVSSWNAREEAERAAWGCPGVCHVENRLFVDW